MNTAITVPQFSSIIAQAAGVLSGNRLAQTDIFATEPRRSGSRPEQRVEPTHIVVFSGHMIDDPKVRGAGKEKPPRFPPAKIAAAAARIRAALDEVGAGAGDLGLCGGASGGDLLFAEACLERSMRVELHRQRVLFGGGEAALPAVIRIGASYRLGEKLVFGARQRWRQNLRVICRASWGKSASPESMDVHYLGSQIENYVSGMCRLRRPMDGSRVIYAKFSISIIYKSRGGLASGPIRWYAAVVAIIAYTGIELDANRRFRAVYADIWRRAQRRRHHQHRFDRGWHSCDLATLTTEERATRVTRGSDGSRFVPWAATVPGVPQKAEASRSAEEQPGASDDSYRQPAVPRSVMAGTYAFACRYLPGLRRRTGDVIEFLWNRNGTLPALRPPSTRFWRD
jgi:hypothetical protein